MTGILSILELGSITKMPWTINKKKTIRVIDWQDEDPQFDGVPEDFHLHIIDICLICGNPVESCVCEMPRLEKTSNGCDLRATEGERMDYLRDIHESP
jgi:hypothetical protein